MKERKTLAQTIAGRLRKSVTKVNPKAKKGLRAVLKARGMSKKQVRAQTKKASSAAKAASVPPAEKSALDRVTALARAAGQLRVTRK